MGGGGVWPAGAARARKNEYKYARRVNVTPTNGGRDLFRAESETGDLCTLQHTMFETGQKPTVPNDKKSSLGAEGVEHPVEEWILVRVRLRAESMRGATACCKTSKPD